MCVYVVSSSILVQKGARERRSSVRPSHPFPSSTQRRHEVKVMDASDKGKQLSDVGSWIVIGLIDAAFTAALFVPYLWELARAS